MSLINEKFVYRIATIEDLEQVWNKDIKRHPDDNRWAIWKIEYIEYNKNNEAKTFVAVNENGKVISQLTLVLKENVKDVKGKRKLCDGKSIANFNAFRTDKKYQGQGHISRLVRLAEDWAIKNSIKKITIGVEASNSKNISIYFHLGFTEFVMYEFDEEENELILYYSKDL